MRKFVVFCLLAPMILWCMLLAFGWYVVMFTLETTRDMAKEISDWIENTEL